ncbi:MAG: SWIM zinc finger family protein, partial [Rhodospirillaceae bacterium]
MTMSASQRAYEEKRAAKHGMSLKQWLAAKATVAAVGKTPIAPSKMARGTGVRLTTRMLVGLLPEDSLAEGNFLQRNKMVKSLAVMPDGTVIGSVDDHRRRRFDLMAAIVERDGRLDLDDKCTCRLGRRCSHVAAAMLAALADHEISPQTSAQPQLKVQKPQPAPPSRHPVELWLDRLIERAAER